MGDLLARVILRPTRPEDLPHVIGEPLPYRIWAITGELDGRVLGVGGLTFHPDKVVRVFAALTDDARRYKVTLHKAALQVLAMARGAGYRRLGTFADPRIAPAEAWLRRLGFHPYTVDDVTVYIWDETWQTPSRSAHLP